MTKNQSFVADLKNGKTFGKYTPALRQFAMTMSFFSTSGYEQLRGYFEHEVALPHICTIRGWYQNVSGGPGMTKQAIEQIKLKISNMQSPLYFSLMMDEMSIRKWKDWDSKNKVFVGFVDYGAGIKDDDVDNDDALATNALVFFLCCVNTKSRLPVAYFFISSLNAISSQICD